MTQSATSDFFDLSPEPLAVFGGDGSLLAANDAFRFLLGRPGSALVTEGTGGFIHPEDMTTWLDALRSLPPAAGRTAVCVRCRAANGDWRWIEWTCSSADARIFAAARDVTVQRSNVYRLHQLEAEMDAVTAEVWLLDSKGIIVQANSYVSTVLGLDESKLIGKRREDMKPGLDSPDECFAETLQVIATGQPVWRSIERWMVRGEMRWASVDKAPLLGPDNAVTNVVVFAYDVTPQFQAEMEFRRLNEQLELRVAMRTDELAAANSALRASEERSTSILANALDAVVTMNRDGFVTGWNKAAERIFGWSHDEATGRELAELIIPREDRPRHRMEFVNARETGTGPAIGRLLEISAVRKDGTPFAAEMSITGVGTGRSIAFTAFIRDIADRKSAEHHILDLNQQLEHRIEDAAAANRELEAFCYSVSHDLRAPLRSIDGFSLAVIEDYGHLLGGLGKDFMIRVRTATQRMARLIDDLLNLSRVSRTEMSREDVNLSTLATDICAELQQSFPSRNVLVTIQPDLVVSGDASLLRIALENLFNNAWKYTARREDARVEFVVDEQKGRRIYRVRDNGAGFDMSYSDKLFAPFQRLHRPDEFEGTGVGLATVLRILHRHGGHAWADGAVDEGATIYFTL